MTRIWWSETHGVTFELVRFFLTHIFDTEMSGASRAWRPLAVSALALALPAGIVLLDPPYAGKGLEAITAPAAMRAGDMADQLAVLMFVFSLTGLLAVLAWQSLFPGRRDHLLSAGLPVRPRQIFAARFIAMALLGAGLVAAVNILPALLPPHRFTAAWDAGSFSTRFLPACLGSAAVFFSIAALQGLLVNLMPARLLMRASTAAQALLICGFFVTGLSSWMIIEQGPAIFHAAPQILFSSPPFWFTCLHRIMLGDSDPSTVRLARLALLTAAAAPLVTGITYLLAYSRSRRLMIETQEGRVAIPAGQAPFLRWLSRSPREEAILRFITATLTRSRTHRLCILAWIGGAVGVMLHAILILGATFGGPVNPHRIAQFIVLYWPIGISAIVIYGVRHAFSMPSHIDAGWLFRVTEREGRPDWMRAVERFTCVCVILPIFALLAPLGVAVMGWAIALRMVALQWLIALSIFDVLFQNWQQLPFTCTWQPGSRPLVTILAAWIAVLGAIVPVLSIIVAAASQLPELFVIVGALLVGIRFWLRQRRRAGQADAPLIYESEDAALPNLGIREVMPLSTES